MLGPGEDALRRRGIHKFPAHEQAQHRPPEGLCASRRRRLVDQLLKRLPVGLEQLAEAVQRPLAFR